jgi:ADP-heptose:LPS heptosyltransferase
MPSRILIYRLGSLGDTVLALPCFRLVRQTYPRAAITVLTNAPVSGQAAPLESVLAHTGLIDDVIPYPLGLRDPRRLAGLIRRLRARKFDLAISLAAARGLGASIRDLLFLKACGIPRIVGIPFRRRDLLCLRRPENLQLFEAESARLWRRARAILPPGTAPTPDFDLTLHEEERATADRLLAEAGIAIPFLAASLGTKTPLNDWGDENWCALLERTSPAHPRLGLVLLGSAAEAARSTALLASWAGPKVQLCGQASPRVSAAILARAALYLGHDSGPLHLAAAAGVRCLAIYSARCPPGQWFPPGEGHALLYPFSFFDPQRTADPLHQQAALASIGVEEVFLTLNALLGQP